MQADDQTLAVGVNLPAHTVVILGVCAWQGPVAGFKEYSDIDVQVCLSKDRSSSWLKFQQMIGRAGRPQFDKTGTCIVCQS